MRQFFREINTFHQNDDTTGRTSYFMKLSSKKVWWSHTVPNKYYLISSELSKFHFANTVPTFYLMHDSVRSGKCLSTNPLVAWIMGASVTICVCETTLYNIIVCQIQKVFLESKIYQIFQSYSHKFRGNTKS